MMKMQQNHSRTRNAISNINRIHPRLDDMMCNELVVKLQRAESKLMRLIGCMSVFVAPSAINETGAVKRNYRRSVETACTCCGDIYALCTIPVYINTQTYSYICSLHPLAANMQQMHVLRVLANTKHALSPEALQG